MSAEPEDDEPDGEDATAAARLEEGRARPPAGFRRELAVRVDDTATRRRLRPRPAHLWPVAGALALVGAALLVVAAALV